MTGEVRERRLGRHGVDPDARARPLRREEGVERRRLRATRRVTTGRRREAEPGARLACLVLAPGPGEWVGVDLATGAIVRGRPPLDGGGDDFGSGLAPFDVVEFELAEPDGPIDPARPEAVVPARPARRIGRLRRARARRLLRRLATPERPGAPVLGSRGPSIAYVDLEGTAPSAMLLGVGTRGLELSVRSDGTVVLAFTWCSARHVLPVLDPRAAEVAKAAHPRPLSGARLTEALGSKPAWVVVGLGPVRNGHAPKAVLALLRK